ncbi:MAG: SURF1 family protein [Hydrotalea sp.]|nr:SURF1 family protein [Hydrotalea sp.]
MKQAKKITTRPKIILPLIIITFLLGVWQCFRLEAKMELIDTQVANQAKPPIAWYKNPNLSLADRGKKFIVRGRLFPDKTIYLLSLAPDESETRGYEPTMPFLTNDNEWLLVSVGFYLERLKRNITSQAIDADVADYLKNLAGKELTLTVYSDPIKRQGMFTPDNIDGSKIWFYINKKQLADKWQRPEFLTDRPSNQFLFKVATISPTPKIISGKPTIKFFDQGLPLPYNRHLEYIATWWLLSFFGFLLYWFGTGQVDEKKKTKNKKNKK